MLNQKRFCGRWKPVHILSSLTGFDIGRHHWVFCWEKKNPTNHSKTWTTSLPDQYAAEILKCSRKILRSNRSTNTTGIHTDTLIIQWYAINYCFAVECDIEYSDATHYLHKLGNNSDFCKTYSNGNQYFIYSTNESQIWCRKQLENVLMATNRGHRYHKYLGLDWHILLKLRTFLHICFHYRK